MPSNAKPANPRNFRNGGWEFEVGDLVRVGISGGQGTRVKHYKGLVIAVYQRFIVVQLPKYRITVSQWELKEGAVKIERLERKAG